MNNYPLILFDGVCNLCNRSINFILKWDAKKLFRYVPIQSESGKIVMNYYGISEKTDSVMLVMENKVYIESDAAIEIARLLSFPWNMIAVFGIIPKKLRDKFYRWIAQNRYQWFGKKHACRIPSANEQKFFPEVSELQL